MNVTQATKYIANAFEAGIIDAKKAQEAQQAIRSNHYGKRHTPESIKRMLANRFGI